MSDTNTTPANSNTVAAKPTDGFYNLTGTISNLRHSVSVTGTPYFVASFATTLRKKPARVALMGFGKTIHNLGGKLEEGATLTLRGSFGNNNKTGGGDDNKKGARTFTTVGFPKAKAAPVAAAA